MELLDCARPADQNIVIAARRADGRWPAGLVELTATTAAVNDPAALAGLIVQVFRRAQIELVASNAVSGRNRADNNAALRAAPTVAGRAGAGVEDLHHVGRRGTRAPEA